MPPTVTTAEPVAAAGRTARCTGRDGLPRPQRDAESVRTPNGKIQFDKDREAAHQYFLQHVNQNTVFFHNQDEKLDYLIQRELLRA